MRGALAGHDAILRREVAQRGGRVWKTIGDAFCCVFPDTLAAAQAALAIHRTLAAQEWGAIEPVAVRAAIHAGIAEARDDDFFGPPLNRVARILAAGHGGQTLVSERAAAELRAILPDGCLLTDLGEHRLKDLLRAERIFQLDAGAPRAFPRLCSVERPPPRLPAETTALIGREGIAREARELLLRDDVRLLTLIAPGGAGKTRLSVAVARSLAERFPDGVHFVPLASVSDPLLVPATIARELGVQEGPGRGSLEALAAWLRTRELLVVLDNFEQILPAAAAVGELLAAAPQLKVLVTSRASLRLHGGHEIAVPPLELPEAGARDAARNVAVPSVRLFLARAKAARPDFVLDDEACAAVVAICRRLDGLPLAIELAAARCRVLPPLAIQARLEDSLSLLSGGALDSPERHRSFEATLDWSYRLLSPAEQRWYRRLSIFVGGFDLDAALACGGGEPLEPVTSLVEKSLVYCASTTGLKPRFGMFETIREFGLERLRSEGDLDDARRAHAGHFLRLTALAEPALRGAKEGQWLALLDLEMPNLRLAIDWSLEQGRSEDGLLALVQAVRFWEVHGYLHEIGDRMQRLLAIDPAARTEVRARALGAAGRIAWRLGDLATTRRCSLEAMALFAELGQETRSAIAWMNLANILVLEGDREGARTYFLRSVELGRQGGDDEVTARGLNALGEVARIGGDLDEAARCYEAALAILRAAGDQWWTGTVLLNLGHLALRRGGRPEAMARLREALEILWRIGHRGEVVACLVGFGGVAAVAGQPREAARLLSAAETWMAKLGIRADKADEEAFSGYLDVARAQLDEASWRAAWAEGSQLELEDAAELASGVT